MMHKRVYPAGQDGLKYGGIDLERGVLRAALVAGLAFDEAHQTIRDAVEAGARLLAFSPVEEQPCGHVCGVFTQAAESTGRVTALLIFQASSIHGGADVPTDRQRLLYHIEEAEGLPWDRGAPFPTFLLRLDNDGLEIGTVEGFAGLGGGV